MQDTSHGVAADLAAKDSFAVILSEMDDNLDVRVGAVLDALVVEFDGNRVSVDVGLKSRGMISAEEFRDDEGVISIKPNDTVKVMVEQLDDGRGNTLLSHLQYRREEAWSKLVKASENDETVEGVIRERIKGGYSVHIDGLRTFLPGSLVDLFPVKSDTALVGKRERFFVERLKPDRFSAILNRRLVRERELTGGDLTDLPFEVGDVMKATVAAVVDYPDFTAYLRIGEGLHGVLHRDNMSWHRIGNVSELLEIDQEVDVKVLDIDTSSNRVHLGIKQLIPDPWDEIVTAHPEGSKIFAKVISLKEYGAFVEIEKGVEGLVHTSEMDWLQRNVQPSKFLEPGQEIEVMVLTYDKSARRISLGLKQCRPNPWEEFKLTYAKGTKVTGVISGRQENLGMFVDLPGGLSGLVHLSNLSYADTYGRDTMANYSNGQEIDVVVLDVDIEKRRVSLGVKQLGRDPFEQFRVKYNNHETIDGKVKKILEKGAHVTIGDSITAFLPISQISEERIDTVGDKISVGDDVKLQIIEMDNKGKLVVSMKATVKATADDAFRKHRAQVEEEKKVKAKASSFATMVKETLGEGANDTEEGGDEGNDLPQAEEGDEPNQADESDAAGETGQSEQA